VGVAGGVEAAAGDCEARGLERGEPAEDGGFSERQLHHDRQVLHPLIRLPGGPAHQGPLQLRPHFPRHPQQARLRLTQTLRR